MEASNRSSMTFHKPEGDAVTIMPFTPTDSKQVPCRKIRAYTPIEREVIQEGVRFRVEVQVDGRMYYRNKLNNQLLSLKESSWPKVWELIREQNK